MNFKALVFCFATVVVIFFTACGEEEDCEIGQDGFCTLQLDSLIVRSPFETITPFDIDQDDINDIQFVYSFIPGNTSVYEYFRIEPLSGSVSIATDIHTDTLMEVDIMFMGDPFTLTYNLGSGYNPSTAIPTFKGVDTIKFPSIISSLDEFDNSFNYETQRLYFSLSSDSPLSNRYYNLWHSLSNKYIFVKLRDEKQGYLKLSASSNGGLTIHEIGFRK